MAYISSENIKVYPCISREEGIDPEARLTAESNTSRIIKAIYNRRYNFVISKSTDVDNFELVVGGYYFSINTSDASWKEIISGDEVWVGIKTQKNPVGVYQELVIEPLENQENIVTTDEGGYFLALYLTNEEITQADGYTYYFKILENGEVPATSLLYWTTDDLEDLSITTEKINDEAVTTDKINDEAVIVSKLGCELVGSLSFNYDTSDEYRTLEIVFDDYQIVDK